jgi:hypothetical protein
LTATAALARGVLAGPHVTAADTPGQQPLPGIPGATGTFTYDAQVGGLAARPLGLLGLAGGGAQALYPGGGIVLVPQPELGVMRVMAWWPDATALQLIRREMDGTATLVRGGSPLRVTSATRRNYSSNPSVETALTGYTAGTGAPTLTQVTRADSVGGQALRATVASAGTDEVNLPGTMPGGLAATIGLDLRFSGTPSAVTVTVAWLTAAGGSAGSTVATLTAAEIVFSVGQMYRQVVRLVPPANAATGTAKVTATGVAAAGYLELDRVTLEAATTDGSYVDGAVVGGQWLGTEQLSVSVIAPVMTLDDGECPLDVPVFYQVSNPSITGGRILSAAATLGSLERTWLTHPARPDQPIVVQPAGSAFPIEHDVEQGVHYALDSPFATVVSAAERRAGTGTITFGVLTEAEKTAMNEALRDLQPLLLRTPAGYDPGDMWMVLGKLTRDPEGRKPWQVTRMYTAPFYEVDAPDPVSA